MFDETSCTLNVVICGLWGFTIIFSQTHLTRQDSSRRKISPTKRPLLDNTQNSQETSFRGSGGIRTCSPSKRAGADPRLRPRGHWDRIFKLIWVGINRFVVTALFSNAPPSHSLNVWCNLVEDKSIRPFLPEWYLQQVAPRTSDFFWQTILPGIILNAWLERDNSPSHFGRRVTEFLRRYYASWFSSWSSHTWPPRLPDLTSPGFCSGVTWSTWYNGRNRRHEL